MKFLDIDFTVTKDTFIPRPETELLVRVCLDIMQDFPSSFPLRLRSGRALPKGEKLPCAERMAWVRGRYLRILDIGTGSGNIAVSLTKLNKTCKIIALDVSEDALAVARENARRHGVVDRIEFIKSDLFDSLSPRRVRRSLGEGGSGERLPCAERMARVRGEYSFDIIVSNPPYVERWEIETLAGHVKEELRAALDGGEDGLDFYRRIVEGAPRYLKDGGFIVMELGYNQAYKAKRLLEESGDFVGIEIFKDYAGINRVIKAKYAPPPNFTF